MTTATTTQSPRSSGRGVGGEGASAELPPPSRIAAAFERAKAEHRACLIPYLTAGYPSLERSADLLDALVAGGATLIEVGVPFSDPLADGATVQAAGQASLDRGTTLTDAIELVRAFRARGHETPVLLMGYANPFYQHGLERLAADAAEAGIDGFIVPDLPSDESEELRAPLAAHGRDLIFMLAPTSTERRVKDVVSRATGFIYCVSLTGVTGARAELSSALPAYIARIRAETDLPLAIGFGISTPAHVAAVSGLADGVVVGAALINRITDLPDAEQVAGVTAFIRSLADATFRTDGPTDSTTIEGTTVGG